ncbi:MAG: hypothetical protein ACJAVK_003344 [Akkermansiaceae bacterium]
MTKPVLLDRRISYRRPTAKFLSLILASVATLSAAVKEQTVSYADGATELEGFYGKGVRPHPPAAGQFAGKYKDDRKLYRQRLAAGLAQLKS